MKGFLKLVLIIAVLYFAYKYYRENYSTEGKARLKAEGESSVNSIIAELKEAYRNDGYEVCNAIPDTPTLGGMISSEPMRQQCRSMVDAEILQIDWKAEAEAYI